MVECTPCADFEILEPYKAYFAPSKKVPIQDAIGQQVSSTFRVYPPGSPAIIQGQTFEHYHLSLIEDALKNKSHLIGIDTNELVIEIVSRSAQEARMKRFNIKTESASDVTQESAYDIGDLFGSGFAAPPYSQFALYGAQPHTALPPSLDFEAWAHSFELENHGEAEKQRLELLDTAVKHAKSWYSYAELDQIKLPEGFFRWAEQGLCREAMIDRFKDPGYVTTVRDSQTGALRGFLHARVATLHRIFETEEWRNPWLFSRYDGSEFWDQPQRFYGQMHQRFGFKPTHKVVIISAQILHPEAFGGDVFYAMMRSMALQARPNHAVLPLICEIPAEGTSHVLNIAATRTLTKNILKNGHSLVHCEKLSDALFNFIADKSHWTHAIKTEIRRQRDLVRS